MAKTLTSDKTTKQPVGKNKKKVTCSICIEYIEESDGRKKGHDAIFCDGACQAWLHRNCAGLRREVFEVISKSDDKFFCPQCRLDCQQKEITDLKETVNNLCSELTQLKSQVTSILSLKPSCCSVNDTTSVTNLPDPNLSTNNCMSYSEAAGGNALVNSRPALSKQPTHSGRPTHSGSKSYDRRCNLVMFGIEESALYKRTMQEIDLVTTVLKELDDNIENRCIIDCVRLGKFDRGNARPRPILVKLNRPADVLSILSKRRLLDSKVTIRPDLSPIERVNEQLLLKERWTLIQSGVTRQAIKIRKSTLLVNGAVHAKIVDNTLVKTDDGTDNVDTTCVVGNAQGENDTTPGQTSFSQNVSHSDVDLGRNDFLDDAHP